MTEFEFGIFLFAAFVGWIVGGIIFFKRNSV